MSLSNAYKTTRIIETIENYSISHDTNYSINDEQDGYHDFATDEEFWRRIISKPKSYWNKKIELHRFIVSEWVARVPGLYWADYSAILRRHSPNDVFEQSRNWIEFNPPGKSKKVLGGIGTILLSPDINGNVLMSVSAGCNASTGIPLLIFRSVLEILNIQQGDIVDIKGARWQQLDTEWSKRFPSTSGIPRGFLIIDSPNKIQVIRKGAPMIYHPFSIMEYEKGDALLYDYVYLTVEDKGKDEPDREYINSFFKSYSQKENRNGQYLINPNTVEPYFETQYSSPQDLQSTGDRAQLNLINARIRNTSFKETTIEELLIGLPKHYDSKDSIKRLATMAGMSRALLVDDAPARMSAQLVDYCLQKNIIEELIDRIIVEYPNIFE